MTQFEKVDALMKNLVGKENRSHSAETIRTLFNLHNEVFNAREYSTSCGGCRKRVYERLRQWWWDNSGKINNH
jgi:hypothetical protein